MQIQFTDADVAALAKRVTVGSETDCWPCAGPFLPGGYGRIKVRNGGGRANWPVIGTHRLAYLISVGPIPEGMFVCHRCDVPPCCNPRHLFLGTHAQNMEDMDAKGRRVVADHRGTANPRAKLSDDDVRAIRQAYTDGNTQYALAREWGVSRPTIKDIVNRRHWRHI